ncbi:MAG: SEC-C domain-containing protein [Clostridia bacterium]|nr:SEC-C domain-containing protein [Clostridia bacterium]
MSIYQEWLDLAQDPARSKRDNDLFWQQYFDEEKEFYRVLLSDHDTTYFGTFDTLADGFEWDHTRFIGFLDGINSSLNTELDIGSIDHDTEITLDIDFEKLLFNMYEAKAPWLYELAEWEDVLPAERRAEIQREWKASKVFVAEKKVGPNDPCPCGSGKKYKKCCGRLAD